MAMRKTKKSADSGPQVNPRTQPEQEADSKGRLSAQHKRHSRGSDDDSVDSVTTRNTLPEILSPAMMTVCVYLKNTINLDLVFWCLPCIEDDELLTKKAPRRARFKKMGEPGTIWSLWYGDHHRGLRKDNKERKKSQQNSIEVDMSINSKNVNFRICNEMIHIVGMSSHEMVNELIDYLKVHLTNLQSSFEYFKKNSSILTDILKRYRGPRISGREKHSIMPVSNEIPEMKIFLEILPLCDTWEGFSRFVKYCMEKDWVISRSFKVKKSHDATAVYSYYLGFRISLRKLAKLAKKKYGFFTKYDRGSMREVSLELAIPAHKLKDRPFKKGAKKPRHTFHVRESGHVKQVSPSHELGLRAFAKFEKLINEIEDRIQEDSESSDSDSEI